MGRKHKRFGESRTPPLRDIRNYPRSMYARVPQAMAQFVLKIEKLSHIMGPAPILEMARAYGLRSRLWLLVTSTESQPRLRTRSHPRTNSYSMQIPHSLIHYYAFYLCWGSNHGSLFDFVLPVHSLLNSATQTSCKLPVTK